MKKLLLASVICCLFLNATYSQEKIVLENENLKVVFNKSDGALINLINKKTNWEIVKRESLGQSFEMLVPVEGRRFNVISGQKQTSPEIELSDNRVVLTWKNIYSEYLHEKLDITFKGIIDLVPQGLVYSGEVINNSPYDVEYVSWPYIGELSVPNEDRYLVSQDRDNIKELSPMFKNEHGYWGVEYPTQFSVQPEGAFLLIRNNRQGLCVISEQPEVSDMVICSYELIPGYDVANVNPESDVMDGQMVRIQFKANHVAYAHSGSRYSIKPLSVTMYEGDWHKGADIYKAWKRNNVSVSSNSPAWIQEPYTWQAIGASDSKTLIAAAESAKNHGISVIKLYGWYDNEGRIMNDLYSAIEKCRKLGIKVVLDVNFTSVDPFSERYESLKNGVIDDPYGFPYNRGIICPYSETARNILMNFAENDGVKNADGVIINDNGFTSRTYYCFNTEHGHDIPAFSAPGKIALDSYFAEQMKRMSDYAVMEYGFFDSQQSFSDGYQINSWVAGSPVHRYINPDCSIVYELDVRNARRNMNDCLKYGYNISLNSTMGDYPNIIEYAHQIELLRRRFQEYIWNGNFVGTQEAIVSGDNISYSVFKSPKEGKRAVIIVNNDVDKTVQATVKLENDKGLQLVVVSPENPNPEIYSGHVNIQPQSAVVIVEK